MILSGTYMIYKFSPINTHKTDGGSSSTNHEDQGKEDKRKNSLMKFGFILILIGTIIQIISLICPK